MIRAIFLTIGLLAAAPAWAQSVEEQIISQLQNQGFTKIEMSRTLLGRVRLKAFSERLERELVFNPTTGEILRDYWEQIDQSATPSPRVFDPAENERSSSSTSGNFSAKSDDDRDDDDKNEDKDDQDDKSDDDDSNDDSDDDSSGPDND